ncbi:hypothetical protein [Streptomyces sp. NPDC054804]
MLHRFERIAAYIPLFGTAVILLVQNFMQGFLTSIKINAAIATLALAFILLAWYLESRIQRFEKAFDELKDAVGNLAREQPRLLGEASSNFEIRPISAAFQVAATLTPSVGVLRLHALSGVQMSSFLQHSGIAVEKCQLLVYLPPAEEADFVTQIESHLRSWKAAVTNGQIKQLEVRRYRFFPTQYTAIFDSKFLIDGLFHPNPDEPAKATVRDPLTVHAQSLSGARLVSEYIDRFDRLFTSLEDVEEGFSMSHA